MIRYTSISTVILFFLGYVSVLKEGGGGTPKACIHDS